MYTRVFFRRKCGRRVTNGRGGEGGSTKKIKKEKVVDDNKMRERRRRRRSVGSSIMKWKINHE